jgi:hypothetical protein
MCSNRLDLKKRSQLGRRPETGNGIKFLKRRSERVAQAPHRSGFKFLVLGREIQFVNLPSQVPRDVKASFNERDK